MKTKTKLIMIESIDIHNLQTFLNQQAQQGWIIKNINQLWITFDYQPNNNLTYSVVSDDYSIFFMDEEDKKRADGLSDLTVEMDYKFVKKVAGLVIYKSKNGVPIYSDESIMDKGLHRIGKSHLMSVISRLIIFIIVFWIMFNNKLMFFTNNINLVIFITFILLTLTIIFDLIRGYHFIKGKTKFKTLKYSTIKTDLGTIIKYITLLIFLSAFILVELKSSLSPLILYLVFAGLSVLSVRYIQKKSWTKQQKWMSYIGLILVMTLIFALVSVQMSVRGVLNSDKKFSIKENPTGIAYLDNQNCRVYNDSKSVLAEYIHTFCDDGSYHIIKSDNESVLKWLGNEILKNDGIDFNEIVKESKVKLDYAMVYKTDSILIYSYDDLPDELIDQIINQ